MCASSALEAKNSESKICFIHYIYTWMCVQMTRSTSPVNFSTHHAQIRGLLSSLFVCMATKIHSQSNALQFQSLHGNHHPRTRPNPTHVGKHDTQKCTSYTTLSRNCTAILASTRKLTVCTNSSCINTGNIDTGLSAESGCTPYTRQCSALHFLVSMRNSIYRQHHPIK